MRRRLAATFIEDATYEIRPDYFLDEFFGQPVNLQGAVLGNVNMGLTGQRVNVNRGLTTQRIDRFERFTIDESTVGHKCLICQDDPAIGTQMVRLDCHVDHFFCEQCAVPWFEGHNTCPTCRQAFS